MVLTFTIQQIYKVYKPMVSNLINFIKNQQKNKNTSCKNNSSKNKIQEQQQQTQNQQLGDNKKIGKIQKKEKPYDINPKGWLKSEDKSQQIMFQKGMDLEEFLFVNQMVLGSRSDLNNLKVLEIIETTRKDQVGGDLNNLDNDFHHMYLILKLEESLLPDSNENKNRVKNFKNYQKYRQQQQNNKEIKEDFEYVKLEQQKQNKNDENNNSNQKRIVWVRIEYLRQSKVCINYALKYRRVPQDFGKLLRIRHFCCKGQNKNSLEEVLEQVQQYQNKQKFDAWEHNCQRMIKHLKQFLDVEEI